MEPNRWKKIEEIYHSALERDAYVREAFVANACGEDAELREEVRSLLAQENTPTEAMQRPVEQPAFPFEEGAMVGPYKLEAVLGAGGMGAVFRALDTRLHRTVAIKVLMRGDGELSRSQKGRFLQEARAASALNHPNIVCIYDISSEAGVDFLVMEYVQGQTLEAMIPPGGLPSFSVARLGLQIASALSAAHDRGIVHRDVKPANVMVSDAQQVKVLDFGIARRLSQDDASDRFTLPGAVVGTVSYMSPEQTRGEPVDGRSDLFSLGCLLFKAATGRLPFEGASILSVMDKIATAVPARPGSLRTDIPEELDRLILACLEKDPRHRPSSAGAVAEQLRPIASHITQTPARRSVAVVPFRFRSAQPEDRFLCVALAEALVNRLNAAGELVVRPTSSVLRFAHADIEWTNVARELNVDYVVEGTIQKLGPKLRVLVEAHQSSDLRTLHSSRHDGDLGDLFALQDRISDAIVNVFLHRPKTPSEPAIPPTNNPLAYELYMRAAERVVHMNRFDVASAIEILCRVVEIDPDFADAWGQLAQAYSQMGMHLDPHPQWFEKGEQAIARTLELDPVQCDALCAKAQILWSPARGFQHRAALRAINAALRVNPNRLLARNFRSVILFHLGHYDQAMRDANEALLANPAYAMGIISVAYVHLCRGEYEEAAREYARSTALDPSLVLANIFGPLSFVYLGRLEEARAWNRKSGIMVPEDPQLTANEALIVAYEGDFRKAIELADAACSATKRTLTHTHHTWHIAAGAYALAGEREKAVAELRRCGAVGLPNYRLFLSDPALAPLRDVPEFLALMSELRRREEEYRPELESAEKSHTR
jgi:serine/threonine-protein kinase